MKKITRNGAMCVLALGLMLSACSKDEQKPATSANSEAVVADNNKGMAESDAVVSMSETDMAMQESKMGRISAETEEIKNVHGAIITIVPKGNNATGTMTIDFGTAGIKSGIDGRTRKGKIQIVYTGKYRMVGSTQTITLDNYYVDGNKIEGTKVLTHSHENSVLITSIKETGGKITFTDGKIIEWNSERTRKWDVKNTPFDITDDEVTVAGTATGKSREGVAFTVNIENSRPLLWKVSCVAVSNYVAVSGVLKITPAGGSEYTVDYGDGNCNKEVIVSSGGASKTISLNN
jgi:hypothetical protein